MSIWPVNLSPRRSYEYEDIRFFGEIYPPRMELEFRLTGADGKVIHEGKRRLQPFGFMMTGGVAVMGSPALRQGNVACLDEPGVQALPDNLKLNNKFFRSNGAGAFLLTRSVASEHLNL
jgi:hypothetical protein